MREQERPELPVTLEEDGERKLEELHGGEAVAQEPGAELLGEGEEGAEEVAHLLDPQRHQQLHPELVEAHLAPGFVPPEHVPTPGRSLRRSAGFEAGHDGVGKGWRPSQRVDDGVSRRRVNQAGGGAVRQSPLRGRGRGTPERDPGRLLFEDLILGDVESHAAQPAVEPALELVEGHLHPRHEAGLLDEHGVLVHREHVQERGHAPDAGLHGAVLQLGIRLAKVHEHRLVHLKRVPRHLHLDAVRRLPTRSRSVLVLQHVPVVTRAAHHNLGGHVERHVVAAVPLDRAADDGEFAFFRVSVFELVHETGRVANARRLAPREELLAQPAAAHLAVRAVEADARGRVPVVEPHEGVVVLV